MYKKIKNFDYLCYVEGYYDMFVNEDGSIKIYVKEKYNIDMVNLGRVFFFFYEIIGNVKYKKVVDILRV